MKAIPSRTLRWWAANPGMVLVLCVLAELALIFERAASNVPAGRPFSIGSLWLVVPIAVTAALSLGAPRTTRNRHGPGSRAGTRERAGRTGARRTGAGRTA